MNAAIKALEPVIRNVAALRKRSLPDNISLDELVQAGRVAAWGALKKWNGEGSLEGYAGQMVGFGITDYLRGTNPRGRSGKKIVGTFDDDEMASVASDDDPEATVSLRQQFEESMSTLPAKDREAVARALAGKGSIARVHDLLANKRNRTPDAFDPDSIPLEMGAPVPPVLRKHSDKFARLLERMPATGSYTLGKVQASSLVSLMKKRGVSHLQRELEDGRVKVFREPSPEQIRGAQ
jgi:RNA polymerase sigma factor (sigma-70 family)